MEKYLENIYKEEYVRTKARNDYERNLAEKSAEKKNKQKYYQALGHTIWGGVILYLLYKIYLIFT